MKNIFTTVLISSLILTTSCLKEDDGAISIPPLTDASLSPFVGGAAQPNQVWIDLSNEEQKYNLRSDWDLGFYSGNEFFVILNNSTLMAAAAIESTNIDAVNEADFADLLTLLEPSSGFPAEYIDNLKGDYLNGGTAIDPISSVDSENKVYLLKVGYEPYQEGNIPPYSTYTAGESRGFKKIRILRNDANSYKIQYADLNETTHSEFIVSKNPEYHFSFFSFKTNNTVDIQPPKNNWDLCFTVWNNEIVGYGTYTYPDYIISNILSGVASYQVTTDITLAEQAYNNFTIADVNESLFISDDQRAIGSTWRSTVSGTSSTPMVYSDRFYIIKDPEGLIYKLRFLSMLSDNNERGFPKFEYSPL